MDVLAAKALGAGLAVIALAGVGVGIGNIFSAMVSSVARNPGARDAVFPIGILGFALTEAVALFALLIAFLILTIVFAFALRGLLHFRQVRGAIPGEPLRKVERTRTQGFHASPVRGQPVHGGGQRIDVAVGVQEPGLAVDDGLAQAGRVARDRRRAAGGCLDVGDTPAFTR